MPRKPETQACRRTKFLVNADGEIVNRFAPTVEPESDQIVQALEKVFVSGRLV